MPRTFSRNCAPEWMRRILSFLNSPPIPSASFRALVPSSGTRLLRGEGRGSSRRGAAPDVMPLDPRLSGQLFAPSLRQLIESMVQIEAQMRRDWKRVANSRASFFLMEQNHFAIRANFIAIFGINRRDRRLSRRWEQDADVTGIYLLVRTVGPDGPIYLAWPWKMSSWPFHASSLIHAAPIKLSRDINLPLVCTYVGEYNFKWDWRATPSYFFQFVTSMTESVSCFRDKLFHYFEIL